MKDKTIDCLKLCSMPFTNERRIFEEEICLKYSRKAVKAKLEELRRRGQIECGASVFCAWLTNKGENILKNII